MNRTRLMIFLCCVSLFPAFLIAQETENKWVLDYIASYREMAIREMQRSGVPASIKLAQGILETEAGRSDLVMRSNNHFGIKCKSSWTGERVYHDDDARGECFRKYTAAEESWRDHSDYLRSQPRYASLFTLEPEDYKGWAYGLKKAGYATNPKYPQILIRFIETYHLNDYTLIALGKKTPMADMAVGNASTPSTEVSLTGDATAEPKNPDAVQTVARPPAEEMVQPLRLYPDGEFMINDTRVIFLPSGSSLVELAERKSLRLSWLLDFNDLPDGTDQLQHDQLIYLQRKRKHGEKEFHEVRQGETMHAISQQEGIRLESLLSLNRMEESMLPAVGSVLYLQQKAPERPALAGAASTNNPAAATEVRSVSNREIRHVVQPKETLYSLAKKYAVGQDQIREWNRLGSEDLKVGQELVIFK